MMISMISAWSVGSRKRQSFKTFRQPQSAHSDDANPGADFPEGVLYLLGFGRSVRSDSSTPHALASEAQHFLTLSAERPF